jgi:hypothetical protein
MRKAADLPNPNPVRQGPGPEERLRNLQRRFRAVSKRHERASDLRRYYRSIKITALTVIVAFAVVWGLRSTISWHGPNLYLFLSLLTVSRRCWLSFTSASRNFAGGNRP